MLERMISPVWVSAPAALSASLLSRRDRMTSTWAFGRMKPAALVSGVMSIAIARLPLGRIAAMYPEPLALISLASRIGSPFGKDWRGAQCGHARMGVGGC